MNIIERALTYSLNQWLLTTAYHLYTVSKVRRVDDHLWMIYLVDHLESKEWIVTASDADTEDDVHRRILMAIESIRDTQAAAQ
jgi:hypothetical protein